MQSVKVVLTDLDGVIRHWSSEALREKEIVFGLAGGHVFSICFEKRLLLKAITGQITDEEWRESVRTKLLRSVSEPSTRKLVEAWTYSKVFIDRNIVRIYKEYFSEARVIVATNATTRLPLDMKLHHLDNMFDGVINSSNLGTAKPAHDFFYKAIEQLEAQVADVIYIDDSAENVQAGKQLGIRSHHYQDHTQLVRFLEDIQKDLTVF